VVVNVPVPEKTEDLLSNVVVEWLTLLREVLGSELCPETGYVD
jgi:hypothetical protein